MAKEPPRTPVWESVAIIAAIVMIWPKIWAYLNKKQWAWAEGLMYAALALMVVVFICKTVRFAKLFEKDEKSP